MSQFFKVQLSIKRLPEEEAVHFKVDGGRFESEKTVKLNVNAKYQLELTFRPSQTLTGLNVQGGRVETEQKAGKDDSTVYTATWVTMGQDTNKKGDRQQVPIIVELGSLGSMTLNLQCKFYPENEKSHCHWGTAVNYIEYECKAPEGASYIDIVKETFR